MSMSGMLQRCWDHDYREPCFYMITIVTEPRRECLSTVECGSKELPPQSNPVQFRQQPLAAESGAAHAAESVAAPAAEGTRWQDGFQDSILLRRGQLKAMAHYIADNPRRLAAKRANPELFTMVSNVVVAPGLPSCPVIGNRYLLEHPLKYQIQASRSISRPELEEMKEKVLHAAADGGGESG